MAGCLSNNVCMLKVDSNRSGPLETPVELHGSSDAVKKAERLINELLNDASISDRECKSISRNLKF